MTSFIIVQTLLLPLSLSLLLFQIKPDLKIFNTLSFLFIWLLPYFWIMGFTVLKPTEALDWLWLSSIVILVTSLVRHILLRQTVTIIIFITGLVIYSWPIIQYQLTVSILIDIFLVLLVATTLTFQNKLLPKKTANNTAIILLISTGNLAIVVGLSGSILIAQLTVVLAASLSRFVFFEIGRNTDSLLNQTPLILPLTIYLTLLFIGRVYAELPFAAFAVLIITPLSIVLVSRRFNVMVSFLLSFGSILWFFITLDVHEYY